MDHIRERIVLSMLAGEAIITAGYLLLVNQEVIQADSTTWALSGGAWWLACIGAFEATKWIEKGRPLPTLGKTARVVIQTAAILVLFAGFLRTALALPGLLPAGLGLWAAFPVLAVWAVAFTYAVVFIVGGLRLGEACGCGREEDPLNNSLPYE